MWKFTAKCVTCNYQMSGVRYMSEIKKLVKDAPFFVWFYLAGSVLWCISWVFDFGVLDNLSNWALIYFGVVGQFAVDLLIAGLFLGGVLGFIMIPIMIIVVIYVYLGDYIKNKF